MTAYIPPASAPRSAFVTSLAWSFIVLGALGVLMALFQMLMYAMTMAVVDMETVISEAKSAGVMPDAVAVVFRYMLWILVSTLGLSILTLAGSVALLQRKEWARLLFIVLLWLGAALNLAGLWLEYVLLNGAPMQEMMKSMTAEAGVPAEGMMQSVMIFSSLVAIVFALLFAWAAIRLNAKEIRNEFENALVH